jgi:hypothetical protein
VAASDRRRAFISLSAVATRAGWRAYLAQGGEQDAHHEPGLEPFADPDQKVRYGVGPVHDH